MNDLWTHAHPHPQLPYRELAATDLPTVSLEGVRVIDVRQAHEFHGELGHLPDAKLAPLATLPSQLRDWSKDATYLMVCRSGNRSAQAAKLLSEMGFGRVVNLAGGMQVVADQANRERDACSI